MFSLQIDGPKDVIISEHLVAVIDLICGYQTLKVILTDT